MKPPQRPSATRPDSRLRRLAGFTILELLVIIAVLAIVALMAAQTLGRTQEMARATQSLRQLQTIGWALDQFRFDNQNFYPAVSSVTEKGTDTAWTREPLGPYLPLRAGNLANLVFVCPNSKYKDYAGYPDKTKLTRTYAATAAMIGLNAAGTATTELKAKRSFFSIAAPAKTVLLVDGRQSGTTGWSASYIYWSQIEADMQKTDPELCKFIDYRHAGSAHLLFCDGHVESAKPSTLERYVNFATWTGIEK